MTCVNSSNIESNAKSNKSTPLVGRLAPSPTGRMHAGNIFSALVCWLIVKSQGGKIVLRIEDLDAERSKTEYIDTIQEDFESLGLIWDIGPYYQSSSESQEAYKHAYDQLNKEGLIYPCFCSRADLHAASAPHFGEKLVYPGTCAFLSSEEINARAALKNPSFRIRVPDDTISFTDGIQGYYEQNLRRDCGDYIVRRSDGAFAYQLAVCVDDLAQGINCVVRGVDLLCSTPQQMYLRGLLASSSCAALPRPTSYYHVPLLVSELNRRLSKRDKDASLDYLLYKYKSAKGVIGHISYLTGLAEYDEPISPAELLYINSVDNLTKTLAHKEQIVWSD